MQKPHYKLLIVPLTSGDLNRLKRCVYSVERQVIQDSAHATFEVDIKIVVNTKTPGYYDQVCREFEDRYEVIETPSDGTPGTGKNSVFEVFRKSKVKYDYLFQIDGDDFLYPTALTMISRPLAKGYDVVSFQSMDWFSTEFTEGMSHAKIDHNLWLYSWCENELNLREIGKFVYVTDKDFGTGGRIFTPGTSMLLSRKFLCKFRQVVHTNEISLFEDYLFFLKLFRLHCHKKIKMCHLNNSFIYVYDRANESSVSTLNSFYGAREMEILKGYVKDHKLEKFHPAKDLPFEVLGKPDPLKLEDKIDWVAHCVRKFPVKLKTLSAEEKQQIERQKRGMLPPRAAAGLPIR